ncbi:MAG TPA: RNA methyltransferase [Bacillota bacterium]|nr:RNA methyltransferase [Bacillota bacterium]
METIQSVQNPRVKNWVRLLSKKGRMKDGLYIIEGEHLVEEALKAKMNIDCLIIQVGQEHKLHHLEIGATQIYYVTDAVMRKLTETQTPQGICAIVQIERPSIEDIVTDKSFILILDALQDPGNLGTIIRTADAVGVDAIILGRGTVDLYNPKVIRSTMGSIFHIPIVEEDLECLLPQLKEMGFKRIAASLEGSVAYDQPIYDGPIAIVIGNEANGVSGQVLDQCEARIKIPIYGKSESLNAAIAAGIILYEVIRQRKA